MLEQLLGSKTRARVLAALYLDRGSYRLLELQRAVGTSISSVQRELERLESLGLARSVRVGDARIIEPVDSHPLAAGIRALLAADRRLSADAPSGGDERLNPAIRIHAGAIAEACRRHGALRAALVGSATQSDPAVVPNDVDVLIRFEPGAAGYAERYFGLLEELERIMGMPVEIIEDDAIVNPYLREEFARTEVVLYEAA